MDYQTAKRIAECSIRIGDLLGALGEEVRQLPDEQERKLWLRKVGDMMGESYIQLLRPVEIQFPDLNPDRD